MSRQPSFLDSLREVPTGNKLKAEHSISLVDHTQPAEGPDTERADSDTTDTPTPATAEPLIKRLTNNSLSLQQSVRQQIAKQKYARYSRDKYGEEDHRTTSEAANSSSVIPLEEDSAAASQLGDSTNSAQTGYFERGRAKANRLMKRRRTGMGKGKETQDTVIDLLYENQRGSFLFGVPRYSSSSLLPSDPKAWQNKDFRTSPVDIRNSQVPDPSWEWVWKGWYVDMSRDVDEEGWEYSVLFRKGFSWHGNHPWFHSFVRRRRWLRMRRRKGVHHVTKERSHELTADYFTIHPHALTAGSDEQSKSRRRTKMDDEMMIEKMEITDIGSLVLALRHAAVDREKLVAVRKFAAEGGDELHYLSERMSEIMGLFIYQSSRRQLLADLIANHDNAHERRESLKHHTHSDTDTQQSHDAAVRHTENLHKAVLAAEEQVKRLEYWSDVKGMAQEDKLLHPEHFNVDSFKEATHGGHPHAAFASKQHHSEGAPELHSHPEHTGTNSNESNGGLSRAPSKQSTSDWFDPSTSPPPPASVRDKSKLGKSPGDSSDGGSSLSQYTTAAESMYESESKSVRTGPRSPAQEGKEKAAKLTSLDGVMEEERSEGDAA
ncbi:hypothetical protein LTR08_000757 [Meristemomyces frigidus]|nr:hypothetical protein LTR08_000757 [Meristemomyces frigidus]